MSFTHDFGVVKDAAALRKRKARLAADPAASPAERAARKELLALAQEAAAVLLESAAFSDAPCSVFISGQANPRHEPYAGKVQRVEREDKGERWTEEQPIEVPAAEHVTVTIQQQIPEGAEPEVAED